MIKMVSEKKKASNYKWDKENLSNVAVRLRKEKKEKFMKLCSENGDTASKILMQAIDEYIKEHEDTQK